MDDQCRVEDAEWLGVPSDYEAGFPECDKKEGTFEGRGGACCQSIETA